MDNGDCYYEMSDSELWQTLKEGDRQSLKVLFERYYDDLFGYAYKVSGDTYLSKDCVQELFYRIWDRKDHLSDVTSVKAYLWVSLRRDIFKAINDNKEINKDDFISHSKLLAFTHEDFIIHEEKQREQKKALVKALNKLPERHKEAIYLKYFNGMGYNEIEKIMSVSYQTARNYVYHGVKALKKEFEDKVFTPARKAM